MSRRAKAIKLAFDKGYRVTEDGQVISPKGKQLSLFAPKSGRQYLRFTIYFEGGPICLDVHRLAGYQKFGDAIFEPDQQVRHLNGIGTDNRLVNLGIGTPSQNALDMSVEKRTTRSSLGGYLGGRANRVFTKDEIHEILRRLDAGETQLEVANSVGVNRRTVNNIKNGKSYCEWYREYTDAHPGFK